MIYRLTMIHINIYYGEPLSNANPYDGFSFQGPGIQCYYMMIRRKLKTMNNLKVKIMEELQVNPILHDIHITFRSPHEVLNQCINYRYMVITEDKHVNIMFSKMQKWEQVADFELYVTLELRVEVGVEEIVQTTTSLHFAILDDRCTILGGYTPPFQETPTTIESEPGNRYEDQFCTHRGESFTLPVVKDEDEDYADHAAINGEDLDDRDEYEERIERDDFDRGVDDHEITPNPHVDYMAECDENDADATIRVQHVTNTPPVYESPTSSFYANTWENMFDPEVVQQAFASSWKEDMCFSTGLVFANKEAIKCALTIYAAKHNKNCMTSRSTKTRLSVKCVDESYKWYVGAVVKPKLRLWMVTSYESPHNCMPLGTALDGRMMDYNFLATEFVPTLQENHTATIDHLRDFIKAKYYGHKLSYYKIWDVKQKTIAKIFGNWEESYQRLRKLLLASVAIAINNIPRYLPYKWVSLILITGLQCLNASMHGEKAQNT